MPALGKELRPELIVISAGPFWMGSEDGQDNEKPIHEVWLDGFRLAKFPVTSAEYRIYVESSAAIEPQFWRESQFAAPQKPVVGVNWFEARSYCDWLSKQTGETFRLPTEAEWEKAARGGLEKQRFPWGQLAPDETLLTGHDTGSGGPQRIGCGDINKYGLCDMSGGVHEWCSDFYDAAYYAKITAAQSSGTRERHSARLARRLLAPRSQVQPLRGAQLAEPELSLF